MKRYCWIILLLTTCTSRNIDPSVKHFGEGMLDLKIFHDNITTALLEEDFDEALWLTEGLDTTVIGMAMAFPSHRLLKKPFGAYYHELLEDEIGSLKNKIESKEAEGAIQAFVVLTNNCNTCHRRHDQEKQQKFLRNNLKRLHRPGDLQP